MNFKEKVIWITGASSGIGEALAEEWARLGAKLILSARNIKKLEDVKHKCELLGAESMVIALDLEDQASITKATQSVLAVYPKIDVLVNNGGISQRSYSYETPLSVDRKIMEVNFFGAVALTKEVLPGMMQNGGGHILAISSVVGKFGFPLRSAYSASKHALQGFFESVRAETVNHGIHVSIAIPGRIVTNISYNAVNKDGKNHGVMDDGQAAGMPVDRCAKKIIKGVRKKKKEILVGNKELLMVHIRRFFPALYYKLASKVKPT